MKKIIPTLTIIAAIALSVSGQKNNNYQHHNGIDIVAKDTFNLPYGMILITGQHNGEHYVIKGPKHQAKDLTKHKIQYHNGIDYIVEEPIVPYEKMLRWT